MDALRHQGLGWNHKRLYRVYCGLGLNQPRRTRRKLPERVREPLSVPHCPDQVWSADFMSDTLYHGTCFRTFNVMDDHNREALAIEIDTSLRAEARHWSEWCHANGVLIRYIQPGKPNQNAYIERFNRTYRNEGSSKRKGNK